MDGLEDLRTHIKDLLVLGQSMFDEHLMAINAVFQRLDDTGLKVNAKKCKFLHPKLNTLASGSRAKARSQCLTN